MHESGATRPDPAVLRELDPVDRVDAAELAVLLFLCPGLTIQELEELARIRTDPANSGRVDDDGV